jgi:tetratricopeptide (TPR) repeat protein
VRDVVRRAAFALGLAVLGLAWVAGVATALRSFGTLPPIHPHGERHIEGLIAAQDWPDAIGQMRMILTLQPTVEIARTLAVVARTQGDRASELFALRRWTDVDPRSAEAHELLASSLLADPRASREELREAVYHGRQAVGLARDSASARTTLARAWLRLGDRERAAQNLQAALEIDPGFEAARAGLRALEAR